MRSLGARDALNLDSGGSSTMVVGRRLVSRPSDRTGERPVSDALFVVP
jgi:exopolysaccharide biosynthesis protein